MEKYTLFANRMMHLDVKMKTVEIDSPAAPLKPRLDELKGFNAKVARIHDEVISLLPSGKADLNYYDLYMELIKSGRYNRYSDICRHVAEVRRKDEAARQLREIKLRQIRIEQQNKLMLEQQRELKKQLSDMEATAQRRHRESQRAIHELSKQIEREADYFYTYTSMFL